MNDENRRQKILTFKLEDDFYGIDIKHVREIVGIQAITPLPELPDYIKGIINLRDKIIPVIAIREKFKMPPKKYNDRTCIIIIHTLDLDMGLIVDTISDVIDYSDKQVVPPPALSVQEIAYIENIGIINQMVTLIVNCETLLKKEEIALIKAEI